MESFAERLKRLRLESGLTQQQLADRIGVSKSILSYYETQERQPSGEILVKLASVFHVSTDFLLGIEPFPCIDVSGLSEEEIEVLKNLVVVMRKK